MANTILTHQMIAREAAAILSEEAPFISNINRGRQEEFGEAVSGYKKGDTVKIAIPPTGVVHDGAKFGGAAGVADEVQEQYTNLTVDTQKHVALQFGAKEKVMDISDFKERVLRPQMRVLSSVVEADLLGRAYVGVPSIVGTPGTVPNQMKTYGLARARLENFLTPPGQRSVVFSSDANTELVDTSKALFHAKKEIERGFLRGSIGEAQGADFYEHQSCPVHTNGSKVAGVTVSGANQAGASLTVGGLTAGDTITKGTVFTIAGVFAVHPLTGQPYAQLQQFVVTGDFVATGATGSIGIYPALKAAAPNKTVSALPANGAGLTFVGGADGSYRQNMMFHRDAFTAAFVPLPVLASCEGYTARLPNGISVRVMTFGDGNNDYERTRIDVLYGFQTVRGLHATRITE